MLVLTRKSGQKIIIGDQGEDKIEVIIIKVSGDQVSVGVKAPADKLIIREELVKEIEKENKGGALNRKKVNVKSLAQRLQIRGLSQSKEKNIKGS